MLPAASSMLARQWDQPPSRSGISPWFVRRGSGWDWFSPRRGAAPGHKGWSSQEGNRNALGLHQSIG